MGGLTSVSTPGQFLRFLQQMEVVLANLCAIASVPLQAEIYKAPTFSAFGFEGGLGL